MLTVFTEFFVAEYAYNKPYSNNNLPYGYVCVRQHPKGAHFLLLLCNVFFFTCHSSATYPFTSETQTRLLFFSSTETVSNDRLYAYYILPYQPEAYETVFLHCHSRFVTPQTGRMFCRTIALPSLNKVIVLYCNTIIELCSTCRTL